MRTLRCWWAMLAVTFAGTAFLCLHKNWPLGRMCFWIAFVGYAALTVYHIVLQIGLSR